jgi:uncharacterized protein YbaP (TraB family)
LLTRLNRVFQVKAELKVEEFKNWYRERSGKAWDADQVSAAQTAPLAGPMATFFERMAIEVMLAREKHLVSLQARLLAEHQRVLVVYGGGHLIYEAAVLRQMLGPPVRIRSNWAIEKK